MPSYAQCGAAVIIYQDENVRLRTRCVEDISSEDLHERHTTHRAVLKKEISASDRDISLTWEDIDYPLSQEQHEMMLIENGLDQH